VGGKSRAEKEAERAGKKKKRRDGSKNEEMEADDSKNGDRSGMEAKG
jgi:hypothetical protein